MKNKVSLIDLRKGEKGIIVSIEGGRGVVQRLTDMGLTPGVEIKVIETSLFAGPVKILVRGFNLALGRGIATKILVKRE